MTTSIGDYVTEIARLFPRQGRWTEDDYFALPESSEIIELINGRLIVTPSPDTYHQDVSHGLLRPLDRFVREHQLGKVYYSPVALRLWEGSIREPDLLFLRTARFGQIGKRIIEGPVDWIAEIISPGSRKTDESEKLQEYAQAGIPEYWLLDPDAKTLRVYLLREAAAYTLVATYALGDTAKSETIEGFSVAVDVVFP
jgi:Uma2 family endonuclease